MNAKTMADRQELDECRRPPFNQEECDAGTRRIRNSSERPEQLLPGDFP